MFSGQEIARRICQADLAVWLNGGSSEKAAQYLQYGSGVNKKNPSIRIGIAEVNHVLRRDRDARVQLEELFKLERDSGYPAEHEEAVKKSREILRRQF